MLPSHSCFYFDPLFKRVGGASARWHAGLDTPPAAAQEKGEVFMETPQSAGRVIVPTDVTIKTVDGSMLQGKINLGLKRRVSDVLTKSEEPFIVLFDATYTGGSDKVLVVNKSHIVWIEPEDDKGL